MHRGSVQLAIEVQAIVVQKERYDVRKRTQEIRFLTAKGC